MNVCKTHFEMHSKNISFPGAIKFYLFYSVSKVKISLKILLTNNKPHYKQVQRKKYLYVSFCFFAFGMHELINSHVKAVETILIVVTDSPKTLPHTSFATELSQPRARWKGSQNSSETSMRFLAQPLEHKYFLVLYSVCQKCL